MRKKDDLAVEKILECAKEELKAKGGLYAKMLALQTESADWRL